MDNIIEHIQTHYNIDIDTFLDYYKAGYSRQEMAHKMNISESVIRAVAAMLGLRLKHKHRKQDLIKLYERLEHKSNINDQLVDENEILAKELYKTNKKLQRCRAELNLQRKMLRNAVTIENFYDRLVDEIKFHLDDFTIDHTIKFDNSNNIENNTLLLALADIHIGNLVDKKDVSDINEFNFDIAQKRLHYIFNNVTKYKAKTLEIVILGDILHGLIHNGNYTGEMPVVEALIKFVRMFSELVINTKKHYPNIRITLTGSNHSRLQQEVVNYKKGYDFDFIIYEFLKEILSKYNISVNYSINGYNLIKITDDKYVFAFHGDTVRNYKPSNEQSLLKVKNICETLFGVTPYLILSGHYHNYQSVLLPGGGLAISVGSMIGVDDYAFNNGYISEPPSQVLLNINNNGEIEWKKIIVLNKDY